MNKAAILTGTIVVVLLAAGCSRGNEKLGSAPRTEKTSSVAGWKDVSTSGVSFRLPSDWKTIEISRDKLEKGIDTALGDDPKFASLRKQVTEASKSGLVKLLAFETSTVQSGFATNCNLIVQDMPVPLTLEQVADANVSQIAPIVAAGTQPKLDYVDAKSGKIALIRYELKPQDPVPEIVCFAYVCVKGQRMAVATFGAPLKSEQHIREVAKQATDEIRFE